MSKVKRTAILFIAILFLVTSLAFSILVIVQLREDTNTSSTEDTTALEAQRSLDEVVEQQANQSQQEESEVLQGTKLENFEPRGSVSELEIIDLQEGTGEVVKENATVTAHYTGALVESGVIFQSSYDGGSPIPFSLNGVIQGWTEGVPGMKVGGVRRLVIPAAKAYGANSPSPDIPANADLVFDITVVSVDQ